MSRNTFMSIATVGMAMMLSAMFIPDWKWQYMLGIYGFIFAFVGIGSLVLERETDES